MIVNRHHDFFFYHMMKCGGTSIREMLAGTGVEKYRLYKHSKVSMIEYEYDVSKFKNSFTVVRNPWERMYSLYCDIHTRFATINGTGQSKRILCETIRRSQTPKFFRLVSSIQLY